MKKLQIKPNRLENYTMYLSYILKVLVDNNMPVQDAWDTVCKSDRYCEHKSQNVFNLVDTASVVGKNSASWMILD